MAFGDLFLMIVISYCSNRLCRTSNIFFFWLFPLLIFLFSCFIHPKIYMNMKTKNERRRFHLFKKPLLFGLLMGIVFFTACQKEEADDPEASLPETPQTVLIEKYFLGDKVMVQKEDDGTYSIAGSDARLFEEQLTDSPEAFDPNPRPDAGEAALAIGAGVRKWTNNTVVYRTSGLSSSVRSELQKSMNEWTSKTNVRFVERTNESNYVTISSSGSNSNSGVATLGMNGSRGFIRLGTRATAVVIIHELGHTLGYIHEQNRRDRDNHIIINYENIQNGARDQFYKSNNAALLTSQFDINSTMMYGSYTFSKNGRPTITDINGNLLPRRQARISNLDIAGTNAAYPGDGVGGPGPDPDSCTGVEEWSPFKRYTVGDRVTYRGRLYERDFSRWIYIKRCS